MSFKKRVQGTTEWDSDSFKISGVLKHGQYTGTEAVALTPENGDVIYVTSVSGVFTSIGFWGYENGAWKKSIQKRDKFFVVPASSTWTVTPNTADHINLTVPHTNQTVLFDFLNSVNEFDPFYFYVPKTVTGTQVNSTNYTGTFIVNSLTGILTTNGSGNFDIPENTFWKIIYRLSGEVVMMQISNVDNTRIEQATITNITFAKQQTYGTPAAPLTGAFTVNNTGAKFGMIQKIYHNAASEPTILSNSTFFKAGSGEYVPSVLNIIFIEWIAVDRYEYWIVQFS